MFAQIYRFSLDNSTPSPVGMVIPGDINSLNVDPIHGYVSKKALYHV